jgi:hypothetical protein
LCLRIRGRIGAIILLSKKNFGIPYSFLPSLYFKFIFLNETDNIKFVDRYCGREKIVERGVFRKNIDINIVTEILSEQNGSKEKYLFVHLLQIEKLF